MINKLYDKDGNPILYDLKNEFAEIINLVGTETNVEKWRKYKAYKVDRYSEFGIDCDVSCLAIQVYNKGWKFLNRVKPTKQYVKNPKSDGIVIREYKYQFILRNTRPFEYYRGDTMTSFTNTYNHFIKHYVENENISEEIESLAKNYHTIGNMIPIPSALNISRAGKYAKYDYWDLTMCKIKEWYDSDCDKNRNQVLYELLNGDSNTIDSINKWLEKFSTWKEFVDENYLSSYVDQTSYNPILFWESHSYDNAELPTNEKSFLNYLRLLNEYIEKRNKEILTDIKS